MRFLVNDQYGVDQDWQPILGILSKIDKLCGQIAISLCSAAEFWDDLSKTETNGVLIWEKAGFPVHETLNGNESTILHLSVTAIQKLFVKLQ